MNSIVLELQRDALDDRITAANLLRKALVVAQKLALHPTEEWIQYELRGYPDGVDLPRHRILKGRVQCFNPYRGWQPVHFDDAKEAEDFSLFYCRQPIPELQATLSSGDGTPRVPFTGDAHAYLGRRMSVELQLSLELPRASLQGVIEQTRNSVLDWSLALERQGVLGEGLSFTPQEVSAATSNAYTNNFFGSVESASIQQDNNNATHVSVRAQVNISQAHEFVRTLLHDLSGLGLTPNQEAEVRADASTIEAQAKSPKPNSTIVRESLRSIRTILEGVASTGAAALLSKLIELL